MIALGSSVLCNNRHPLTKHLVGVMASTRRRRKICVPGICFLLTLHSRFRSSLPSLLRFAAEIDSLHISSKFTPARPPGPQFTIGVNAAAAAAAASCLLSHSSPSAFFADGKTCLLRRRNAYGALDQKITARLERYAECT